MHSDDDERGSPDDQVINLDDGDEVRHYCRLFDATPDQLRAAVAKAGPGAFHVRHLLKFLEGTRNPTP